MLNQSDLCVYERENKGRKGLAYALVHRVLDIVPIEQVLLDNVFPTHFGEDACVIKYDEFINSLGLYYKEVTTEVLGNWIKKVLMTAPNSS